MNTIPNSEISNKKSIKMPLHSPFSMVRSRSGRRGIGQGGLRGARLVVPRNVHCLLDFEHMKNHLLEMTYSQSGCWFGTWMDDFSHHIGNVIIPTDFHSIIFQRGRSTTNQPIVGWCSYKGHLPTLEGYECQLISRVGDSHWENHVALTSCFFSFFEDGKPHHHEVFIVGFTWIYHFKRSLAHGYVSQYLPRTERGDEHWIPWRFTNIMP